MDDDAPLPRFVHRCARKLLDAVRHACTTAGELDPALLCLCASLIAAEVLPQSARWHRRDLSPALLSAWRAVLRATAPPPAVARGVALNAARARRLSKAD